VTDAARAVAIRDIAKRILDTGETKDPRNRKRLKAIIAMADSMDALRD